MKRASTKTPLETTKPPTSEFQVLINGLNPPDEIGKHSSSPRQPLTKNTPEEKTETVETKFERLMQEYEPKRKEWIPDWKSRSSYEHLETASPERLAWEFLRRNRHYQKECDESPWDDDDALAGKWGLSSLGSYSVNYTQSGSPRNPKWIANRPHLIASSSRFFSLSSRPTNQIQLEDEQIAVVFDIGHKNDWLNVDLLSAQVEFFKSVLTKAIENSPSNQAYLALTKSQPGKLIECLRVADALTSPQKASRKEIGRQFTADKLLFKKKIDANTLDEITDAEYSGAVSNYFEAAYRLIYEYGYLALLLPKQN